MSDSEPDYEDIQLLKEAGYTDEDIKEYIIYRKYDSNNFYNPHLCKCQQQPEDLCKHIFDYSKLPDLSKIKYNKLDDKTTLMINNKTIEFWTPRIYLPFGIDKYYNHWSLNLEINNMNCIGNQEFKQYLVDLEKRISDFIEISKDKLNSQIVESNGTTKLYARIQKFNNSPKCKILAKDKILNKYIDQNIYSFPEQVYIKARLRVGHIWKLNSVYCYKLTCTELKVVD